MGSVVGPKPEVVQRSLQRPFSVHRICRRAFLLLLTLFTAVTSVLAADVSGVVTNAQGGEPLARIQVTLLGTTIATVSGPDGRFRFSQLPAGSYVLQVSGVGYRSFTVSFELTAPDEIKEFTIVLVPENLRFTDRVRVTGEVFESKDWPAVGDLTLTSSELRQTSTVLADDPFRSLQALPGVSPSANNDFLAQFSVTGAPYSQVGVYVDDVLVPNLLHAVANTPDAPTLSLFTGNDVDDIRLLPVAYPVRYADGIGAALAIRTRTGSDGPPHFHGSAGLAYSEILGEGRLTRKGPYQPTLDDQRHTANIFGSYRLTPSVRLSAKAFYGSGFPAEPLFHLPTVRIGPYERSDHGRSPQH